MENIMWNISIASWRIARELRFEAAEARELAATFGRPDVSRDLRGFAKSLEDDAARLERALGTDVHDTCKKAELG
jgi:hypothetical protein